MKTKFFNLKSIALLAGFLRAASADPLKIDWYSVNGGGGSSSAGSFTMSGSIGQPDAGRLSGGTYTMDGGYWGISKSATPPGKDINWVNNAGGDWNVASNWSPAQVPTADDRVTISTTATATVTLNTGATVARFTFKSGTLTGTGKLEITDQFEWDGGTMSGSGSTVADGSSLWSGGPKILSGRTLVNNGAATWSAGTLTLQTGAVLNNSAQGLIDVTFDTTTAQGAGGVKTINNAGIIRKETGLGTLGFVEIFNNSGKVEVLSGTLRLTQNGNDAGNYEVADTAALEFGGGIRNLNAGSGVTGVGTVIVSGGTVNVKGRYSPTGLSDFRSGIVNFDTGAAVQIGILKLSGATLGGADTIEISKDMTWSSGTLTGTGAITIDQRATLALNGAVKTLNGRTLNNFGHATWSGGNFFLQSGGIFNNNADAVLEIAFDGTTAGGGGGTGTFNNLGTITKSAGLGTATLADIVNNSGEFQVRTGTIRLTGGGADSGGFEVAANAALDFGQNIYTLSANSKLFGDGNIIVSGATVNMRGRYLLQGLTDIRSGTMSFDSGAVITIPTLSLSGGALAGADDLQIAASMTWSGGTMSGIGATTLREGCNLSMNGTTKTIGARTLNNRGHATWTAGGLTLLADATINNASSGVFDVSFDVSTSGSSGLRTINNAGLFRKTAGIGTTTFIASFNNTGAVEVQSGVLNINGVYIQGSGSTFLNGGNFASTSPLRIQGGLLTGNGAVGGSLTNGGVISPGPGIGQLSINGSLTQTSGSLNIEVNAASKFDMIIVTNVATLNGAINVTVAPDYHPATNTLFSFLSAKTRTGTFSTFNYPTDRFGMKVDYFANAAAIEITSVVASNAPIRITQILLRYPDIRIDWSAIGGQTYLVQAADALNDFRDISPPIVATGAGSTTGTYQQSKGGTNRTRFFRVRTGP